MNGELSFTTDSEEHVMETELGPLGDLEEKIGHLLVKFQELMKERDELALALDSERERAERLEKKMQVISQERENVKMRIDQLLYRLKDLDLEGATGR